MIGLNVGPNLFATGSLAWVLWLRAARNAGAHPSVRQASALGVLSVPDSASVELVMLSEGKVAAALTPEMLSVELLTVTGLLAREPLLVRINAPAPTIVLPE